MSLNKLTLLPPPKNPQRRLFKIAAFAMARINDEQKSELKTRYEAEELDDTEFIRKWALIMDNDPALMAKNEAIVERISTQENQPVYYYEDTSSYNYDDIQNQIGKQNKKN